MALPFPNGMMRFLSEPRGYICSLPQTVDTSRPQLASVVGFAGRARAIEFNEGPNPSADPDLTAIGDLDRDGVTVSLFRFSEPPPLLIAQWRLGDARYLSTFMPEPDSENPSAPGREGLETVIQNITIGWAAGLPVISLGRPLEPGDVRDHHQRETARFLPRVEPPDGFPLVEFRREPPWVRESASVTVGPPMQLAAGGAPWSEVSIISRHQVRISCAGPASETTEIEEAVMRIAATLEPE